MELFYETAQILIKLVKTTKTQVIVSQCVGVSTCILISCNSTVYRWCRNLDTILVKGQKSAFRISESMTQKQVFQGDIIAVNKVIRFRNVPHLNTKLSNPFEGRSTACRSPGRVNISSVYRPF